MKAYEKEQPEQGMIGELYDWVEALISALVTVILVFTFVFRIVGVVGTSMLPTLHEGDRVILSVNYTPKYGDIVVLNKPNFTNKPFIKRVIAVAGQTVDINYETGSVYVDGVELNEPYIREVIMKKDDVVFPLVVPEGEILVMGDNRNGSTDSRSTMIGTVDERYIMGHAVGRIFPLTDIQLLLQ